MSFSSPFTTEIFNPALPVRVPVTHFAYGKRLRVVVRPLDRKDKQFHVKSEERGRHYRCSLQSSPQGWRLGVSTHTILDIGRLRREELVYSNGHFLYDFEERHFLYDFEERQSGWSITSIDIGGDVHVHSVQIE
ncbi:hypothetical protein COOONC_24573 [Cooperia oncophora]